jgi:AcrR family transcriptional regulator
LDAASASLLQRGYSGLRFKDVSRASGVPVASLRHYFPSLESLRKEALLHLVRVELDDMRDTLAGVEEPWERLRLVIIFGIDPDPASRRDGWVQWLDFWRVSAHDAEMAADARLVHDAWLTLLSDTIEDGVQSGLFQLDQSVAEAAREFYAVLDGIGLDLAITHTDEDARASMAAVERAVRRMLGMPQVPDQARPR